MSRRPTLRRNTHYSHPQSILFEIWNKSDKPIYFRLLKVGDHLEGDKITVAPNEVFSLNTEEFGITKPTGIFFFESQDSTEPFVGYRMKKNKLIFVRVKRKKNNRFIFGAQTGAFLGIARSTDSGLSKKNNVTKRDIEEIDLKQEIEKI